MNDGGNTEGLEEWDGSVCRRHVSPGLLPPSEGWGGCSWDRLTGSIYSSFFSHWWHIFFKNTSAPSVGESLLTGRRNYLIILSFAALEVDCFHSTFVAQWLKSLAKLSCLNYWIHIVLCAEKSLKTSCKSSDVFQWKRWIPFSLQKKKKGRRLEQDGEGFLSRVYSLTE